MVYCEKCLNVVVQGITPEGKKVCSFCGFVSEE